MLLNQRINSLKIIIIEKKIIVIFAFRFFLNFQNLNYFLNLIDWLRFFVFKYTQQTNSLQKQKIIITQLLSTIVKNSTRKQQTIKIQLYNFTHKKIDSFQNLKNVFKKLIFFIHFDRKRKLFANLNSFKSWNFVDIIYYIKNNSTNDDFSRTKIQFIIFFNRCFNETKKNY